MSDWKYLVIGIHNPEIPEIHNAISFVFLTK